MTAGSEHHRLTLLGRTAWQLELWKYHTLLSRRSANIEHQEGFATALSGLAITSMRKMCTAGHQLETALQFLFMPISFFMIGYEAT